MTKEKKVISIQLLCFFNTNIIFFQLKQQLTDKNSHKIIKHNNERKKNHTSPQNM